MPHFSVKSPLPRHSFNLPWKLLTWRRTSILTLLLLLYYIYSIYDEILISTNIHATETWHSSSLLPRIVNEHSYDIIMDTLKELLDHFQRMNVTAVLWAGALLGSYMFHDIVPWDDDLDLWIAYTDLPKVKRYFRNKTLWEHHGIAAYRDPLGEYDLRTLLKFPDNVTDDALYQVHPGSKLHSHHQFKFFLQSSSRAGANPWRWPFVDVVFYRENDTHVWNDEEKDVLYLQKDTFYPLIKRPLGRHWINAPSDTGHYLRSFYGSFSCSSNTWLHSFEHRYAWLLRQKVECAKLWSTYPQVWAKPLDEKGGEVEILKVGNRTIHEIVIKDAKMKRPSRRPFGFWF